MSKKNKPAKKQPLQQPAQPPARPPRPPQMRNPIMSRRPIRQPGR